MLAADVSLTDLLMTSHSIAIHLQPYPPGGDLIEPLDGAAMDLRFLSFEYLMNGESVGSMDAYQGRTTSRYASDLNGQWNEFAANTNAVYSVSGYDTQTGATNLSELEGQDLTADGATTTPNNTDLNGWTRSVDVASSGTVTDMVKSSNFAVTASTGYTVRVLYLAGTSGRCRITVTDESNSLISTVRGLVGALDADDGSAGAINNIENRDRGNGIYECWFNIGTGGTPGANWTLGTGPDSATLGESVTAIVQQAVVEDDNLPYADGTTDPDSMLIASADAGMSYTPSVDGITVIIRAAALASLPTQSRFYEFTCQTPQSGDRLRLYYDQALEEPVMSFGSGGVFPTVALSGALNSELTIGVTWASDGSYVIAQNGQTTLTGTSTIMQGQLNHIGIGNSSVPNNYINGRFLRVASLPNSVTQQELEDLVTEVAGSTILIDQTELLDETPLD